ncbi:MAG TPA: hypothetical protein VHH72_06525 [Solirubrobacterales bacterium]|nr:hypothetical protein [Solirubrobacterales bacterium]
MLAGAATLGVSACGGGERQDADEPEGEFPVEIAAAEFPAKQRLAQTSELTLSVRNTGDETIPDLAITVFTDPDTGAEVSADEAQELPRAMGAFSVISQQAGLAIPSRPVWILEQGYPRVAGTDAGRAPPGELSGAGGAEAAQTNTFSFGSLEAGDTRDLVWVVTPVQPGTYTVHYRIAAGLHGKAIAVNADGSVPEGEFVVRISDVPPQTRVDDSGRVVPIKKSDLIGQAGTDEQKSELDGSTP